ncbi:FtsK/SpoIIIE domain-containing protein [Clostridium minihomine]|uniref:FtsK/SpoIIIE domain-containing protein n=1 Tax=Clostridium minihomine TaxID=2045012 RepID=UPI000C756490|nr:FtsK/SpoIIIE domain-containing protein [Clostridium minihomine]
MSNDPVGDILGAVLRALGKAFFYAGKGIKRLKAPQAIIGLLVSIAISTAAYMQQQQILKVQVLFGIDVPVIIRYLLYWTLLLFPLLYLIVLGSFSSKKAGKYEIIFKDIGFMGKDRKYPYLLNEHKDGKKVIYTFKSNIPLTEWKKNQERIETGMDCSIRQIAEGNNKKIVKLITVPSDYKIPELIKWDDSFIQQQDGVIVIGESDLAQVSFDLNRTPHVLAAGETGSGKSVILRCILWQMINKGSRIYMIDFKGGVEFGKAYERFGEVVTDRKRALTVLQNLTKENEARLQLFRELEVKNLKAYNQKTGENLSRIGVFIDEIAEMLDKKGVSKEDKPIYEQLEGEISTLARLARATGINLFLGVQRPDANVLTGQIKNNIPVRISGRFADKAASEIVLANTAACDLPDIKGRFLYKVGNETVEFQSYWFNDDTDLHDVDLEPGDMLTEASTYKPTKKPKNSSADMDLNFNFDD